MSKFWINFLFALKDSSPFFPLPLETNAKGESLDLEIVPSLIREKPGFKIVAEKTNLWNIGYVTSQRILIILIKDEKLIY